MSKNDYLKRSRDEWCQLIERFILAFGDIENISYFALFQLPTDKIFKTTSTLNFTKRVDLILELLEDQTKIPKDEREKFEKLLNDAKKLAETRNIVAHSPLMMKVYEHPVEGLIHKEEALGTLRNKERAISVKDLTDAADRVEDLAKGLVETYRMVYRHIAKNK